MNNERRAQAGPGWWERFPLRSRHGWLNVLLLAAPATAVLEAVHAGPAWIFVVAALAIVPLAGVLGEATDALAERTGPLMGGVLNATMGNATELIIGVFALRTGQVQVVKASLSGSILGNLLLVLGTCALVGGWGREKQEMSRTAASANVSMLFVAAAALVMPALLAASTGVEAGAPGDRLYRLSLGVGGVLVILYALSLLFLLRTHAGRGAPPGEAAEGGVRGSTGRTVVQLALATGLIAWLSEVLTGAIEPVTRQLGMTELFVGVVVVALIGNVAEHSTAVLAAERDHMDLAVQIAVGSSTQIALFVAPVLVFASALLGHPMALLFTRFEIAGIFVAVLTVHMIAADGETNWFEGVLLLALYCILAVSFWFVR